MEDDRQLRMYGNSFVVSIPRKIIELVGLEVDDNVTVKAYKNKIIIKKKDINGG